MDIYFADSKFKRFMNRLSISIFAVLCIVSFGTQQSFAQGYYGDADSLSCNCYRLTEAEIVDQGGFVWSDEKINLNTPFDYTFDVYLGQDIPGVQSGGDGIAFVLQPIGTSQGNSAGGMGYSNISPSLAMTIDTYNNGNFDSDIVQDHVSIMANGATNHTSADNLAGPLDALVSGMNIEDGLWHVMRVSWDPATQVINFYMDGALRTTYTGNIITDIFSGDPLVYWGFTGATGTLTNLQQFCFSIIPGGLSSSNFDICEGQTINFSDNSYSALGDIIGWDWNFGDGQLSTEQEPGEIEFTQAGNYWVTQTITDIQGCEASDSLEIVINPRPVAAFTATEICEGEETDFQSTSTGSVNDWNWNFGSSLTETGSSASNIYTNAGSYEVELAVETTDGCVDTITTTVNVFANPTASATSSIAGFYGTFTADLESDEEAEWTISGTSNLGINPFNYTFPDSGWYEVMLIVTNGNGCSDIFEDSVYIEPIPGYETPNVFTPNGDEFNERFQPETFSMLTASMQVFNRWGRPVFSYDGVIPSTNLWGWDGTVNGGPEADAGTYYYILNLRGIDGNSYPKQGAVTLLR
jgi:gliding motility-associated-like protein